MVFIVLTMIWKTLKDVHLSINHYSQTVKWFSILLINLFINNNNNNKFDFPFLCHIYLLFFHI